MTVREPTCEHLRKNDFSIWKGKNRSSTIALKSWRTSNLGQEESKETHTGHKKRKLLLFCLQLSQHLTQPRTIFKEPSFPSRVPEDRIGWPSECLRTQSEYSEYGWWITTEYAPSYKIGSLTKLAIRILCKLLNLSDEFLDSKFSEARSLSLWLLSSWNLTTNQGSWG